MEGHKLLLDKLLATLGAQPRGHAAQAATVVRAKLHRSQLSHFTKISMMDAALYLHAHF